MTDKEPGGNTEALLDKVELMEPKKMTRFKVNKVDLSLSSPDELNKLCENVEDSTANYAKSFRHFTREALPRLDNYRNIMSIQAVYRPTLDDLHEDNSALPPCKSTSVPMDEDSENKQEQLGWFRGVYVKNLVHLWGIIFYLRLTWTLGQAGILEGLLIILTSSGLAFITALSVSAISSNGLAQGGGAYVMISRSLGPEFGASIGFIFSFANSMLTSLCIIGVSELLVTSFSLHLVDGGPQDICILGVCVIFVLLCVAMTGVTLGYRVRVAVFVILFLSILNILIGTILSTFSPPSPSPTPNNGPPDRGLHGFSLQLLEDNLFSSYSPGNDFFTVLGVYFPAIIGFLNGANCAKELKDPCCDIPKGTLRALLTGTLSYIVVGLTSAAVMVRSVNPASFTASEGLTSPTTGLNATLVINNSNVIYGLRDYFESLEVISAFSPLFYLAVLTSGFTCALSSLQEAPRVLRLLAKDSLYPYMGWFGAGSTWRPYTVTTGIAVVFILVGNLNALAPLIATPFLAAYALVNFSVFHASLVKPIGWRPTFKLYNMWLSLSGAILCTVVMFLICWITALLTLILILALYLIIVYRKPDVNWGSTAQAQTYRSALEAVQSLNHVEEHVKNYSPQILVLSGLPSARPALVDFAALLSKNISLLICGHITKVKVPDTLRKSLYDKARHYLSVHKIKAFYNHVDEDEFDVGAKALLQCSGMGKLRPNLLMMGYKTNWTQATRQELQIYFNVIHMVLDNYKSMCILRVKGGFDYSSVLADTDVLSKSGVTTPSESLSRNVSASQFSHASSSSDSVTSVHTSPHLNHENNKHLHLHGNEHFHNGGDMKNNNMSKVHPVPPFPLPVIVNKKTKQELYKAKDGSELSKEVFNSVTQFQRKQHRGTIDVWWLYDDGGLTLLLPYIISTRHQWSSCKLRVFALANKKEELEFEQRNIASLLAKFRIDYTDLIIITTITRRPHEETVEFYNNLVQPFLVSSEMEETAPAPAPGDAFTISQSELAVLRDKTNRQLRLRELLLENSLDSALIVMTLPMPRKNIVSAPIYMSWLEALTRDMPNFLLVRGNQTSVLTFYS
ncbi:hypothetical protein WDU94_011466 [Cyamophila willieti]